MTIISRVSSERSRLGAIQNRLESTIRNLDVSAENLTSSKPHPHDVDVALRTMRQYEEPDPRLVWLRWPRPATLRTCCSFW
ncbi:MAG: flagellin [bacterium]